MEGNTFLNLRSALIGSATIFEETFRQYIPVLIACLSLKYLNSGANLSIDNPVAWNAFLVALLIAIMALGIMRLASRNTSELPTTSNQITPPTSNFMCISACIFLIYGFLALFFLSYVLHPFFGWFIWLCLPLFLSNKIPHSSYYYHKAIEWLAAISIRLFNILRASFQHIFRPPQKGEAAPQASNVTPPTTV